MISLTTSVNFEKFTHRNQWQTQHRRGMFKTTVTADNSPSANVKGVTQLLFPCGEVLAFSS